MSNPEGLVCSREDLVQLRGDYKGNMKTIQLSHRDKTVRHIQVFDKITDCPYPSEYAVVTRVNFNDQNAVRWALALLHRLAKVQIHQFIVVGDSVDSHTGRFPVWTIWVRNPVYSVTTANYCAGILFAEQRRRRNRRRHHSIYQG